MPSSCHCHWYRRSKSSRFAPLPRSNSSLNLASIRSLPCFCAYITSAWAARKSYQPLHPQGKGILRLSRKSRDQPNWTAGSCLGSGHRNVLSSNHTSSRQSVLSSKSQFDRTVSDLPLLILHPQIESLKNTRIIINMMKNYWHLPLTLAAFSSDLGAWLYS